MFIYEKVVPFYDVDSMKVVSPTLIANNEDENKCE